MIGFPEISIDEMLPPRIQPVRCGCMPVIRISPSPAASVAHGPCSLVATCSSQVPRAACSLTGKMKVAVHPALGSGQLQATLNGLAAGEAPPGGGPGAGAAAVVKGEVRGEVAAPVTSPARPRCHKAVPTMPSRSRPTRSCAVRFVRSGLLGRSRGLDDGNEGLEDVCADADEPLGATGARLGPAPDALGPVARGLISARTAPEDDNGTDSGSRLSAAWPVGDRAGWSRASDG